MSQHPPTPSGLTRGDEVWVKARYGERDSYGKVWVTFGSSGGVWLGKDHPVEPLGQPSPVLVEEWERQYEWAIDKLRWALGVIRTWDMLNPADGAPEPLSDGPFFRKMIDEVLSKTVPRHEPLSSEGSPLMSELAAKAAASLGGATQAMLDVANVKIGIEQPTANALPDLERAGHTARLERALADVLAQFQKKGSGYVTQTVSPYVIERAQRVLGGFEVEEPRMADASPKGISPEHHRRSVQHARDEGFELGQKAGLEEAESIVRAVAGRILQATKYASTAATEALFRAADDIQELRTPHPLPEEK